MNPPTEQLIRDYLNRVSVAARGRLSADDRRAFLARTREFIEQNTRAVGRTQTTDVLKLLAELGDPVSLVHAERDRLAAGAAEPGADTPADTSLAARARRLRNAPANVASLLRTSATVIAPGDAPVVAEPDPDNPMTGDFEEIVQARRPISSRWRPGDVVIPRPPRQPRRPGLPRRPRSGGLPAGGGPRPAAPAEPPPISPGPSPGPSASAPASPDTDAAPPARPAWPSVAARRPAADSPSDEVPSAAGTPASPPANPPPAPAEETDRESASSGPDGGPGSDWAVLNAAETDWADPATAGRNWTDPAADQDSRTSLGGSSPSSLTNGRAGGPATTHDAPRPDSAPPLPADAVHRRPADTAGPGEVGEGSAGGAGSGPVSARSATEGAPETGSAGPGETDADRPGASPGESVVSGKTLVGPPPAPGEDTGPQIPPRGARVTWASGVRSRTMRMSAVRAAGTWLGGARRRGSRDDQAGPVTGTERAERDGQPDREWEFLATVGAATGRTTRVVMRWVRRHPLEAAAVVLLGLGGLIYPPVWLMGAVVATFSKAWDIRDKWIGMGLPVFLVIVGIVVEVSLDGSHRDWVTYVRDAWVFAGHLSRILALLGAIYLAWRTERAPRGPVVPPWQKGGQ